MPFGPFHLLERMKPRLKKFASESAVRESFCAQPSIASGSRCLLRTQSMRFIAQPLFLHYQTVLLSLWTSISLSSTIALEQSGTTRCSSAVSVTRLAATSEKSHFLIDHKTDSARLIILKKLEIVLDPTSLDV